MRRLSCFSRSWRAEAVASGLAMFAISAGTAAFAASDGASSGAAVTNSVRNLAATAASIEATTSQGDRVRLHPDGRWEYVDARKADAQRPIVERYEQERDREKSLEQGGLLGIGRKVKPGDADYNRGSLGGKSK